MKYPTEFKFCKLEIFIPETHLDILKETLRRVDAGHIGSYDCCLSYSRTTGCWRPLPGSDPFIGKPGEICTAPEIKVEAVCRAERVEETIAAVKAVHPYEVPVINAIPLFKTGYD